MSVPPLLSFLRRLRSVFLATLTWWVCHSALHAANPILQGYSDPAVTEHEGRLYFCVGKDRDPNATRFEMPYWSIFSTDDLVNYRLEKHIDPELISYMGKGNLFCWAADIKFANGRFYFYFSNHNQSTGVLVADKPDGTYEDVLKKPLVAPSGPHDSPYDPTIFVDTDGQAYLIFGRDGHLKNEPKNRHYQIARLNPDMISLAEAPRNLMTDREYGFGEENRATDHSYFHKHGDTYYLSRDESYMTSKSVYGPFERLRNTGDAKGASRGHASYFDYRGQSYHAYEFTDQRYKNRIFRQTMITYLHYLENGDMVDEPFFLRQGAGYAVGVGNYDANWEHIQAEWFFSTDTGAKRSLPGEGLQLAVKNTAATTHLCFPKIHHVAGRTELRLRVSCAQQSGARIEIREKEPRGRLLGAIPIAPTGSADQFQTLSIPVNLTSDDADLCFVLSAQPGALALDWFSFAPAQNP